MNKDLPVNEFLVRNNIDEETWKRANIEWDCLMSIAQDHEAELANLENTAELFAKVVQKFHGVHSVRWRVKSSEHLLEKIIRKRADQNPKYAEISAKNYYEHVTDLIGIRALHLFKEDCFEIDAEVLPLNSARGNLVKSVFEKENGLEEAVFRRTDHRIFEAGGSRGTGEGIVSSVWIQ